MFQEVCLIFLATLLLATASPVVLDASLRLQWESWKSTHSKTYSHEEEESGRSTVWLNNKKFIDTHNAMGEGSSYSVAMNEYGDMVSSYAVGGM